MSYEDFQKMQAPKNANASEFESLKKNISREEFEKIRTTVSGEMDTIAKGVSTGKIAAADIPKVMGNSLKKLGKSAIGMPMFFYEYNREQTGAKFVWAFAEWGLFLL